jgi:hypothetical protein
MTDIEANLSYQSQGEFLTISVQLVEKGWILSTSEIKIHASELPVEDKNEI